MERIGIVGGGQMGSGIAEVCAKAGSDVVVVDVSPEVTAASQSKIEKSLAKAVERGKLEETARDEALGRLRFGTDLAALADRQMVVEAIVEDEVLKAETFAKLDAIVTDPDAILATNTSSIPIIRIARATARPESVIGLHFFNPAPVMPLVEVVYSILSDETVVERAAAFVGDTLGKTVVRTGDRAGFIVNALLVPYMVDAMRMLESGYATAEEIDAAMTAGAGYPMGPFTLADLIGNDTMLAVAETLYEEFREPRHAPPPLLKRMVEAGLLGRKSGRGFYDYRD